MNSLLAKMKKSGIVKESSILSESNFFNEKETVTTSVPIINIAFSGDIDGGFSPGITLLAGESKTFKSSYSLYCLKAFQDKYKDGICLFYDCEYGITPQYLNSFGIDTDRVLHIPIENVEQMKFDIVQKLEEIDGKKDKIFILVDSLGNLASKKEVEDALSEKSAADMTRAKAIRSMFRIITPHISKKGIFCFIVNHIYQSQGLFSQTIIGGGTSASYVPNVIFVITKSQEKTGTDVTGYKFTLNVHKSRYVKEKSKFPFIVDMTNGINKWSGLLDLGLEFGYIAKPSNGWFCKVNKETGELLENTKCRAKNTESSEFWDDIINNESFKKEVRNRYQYGCKGSDGSSIFVEKTEDNEGEE